MKPHTAFLALRFVLVALGIIGLVLTIGLFTFQGWATGLVPWELNPLGSIFLASISAAAALPMLWIAWTREYAAMTGGGFDFGLMFAGFAAFSFQVYFKNPRLPVLLFGLYCAAGLIACLGLIYLGTRHPFSESRPTPRLVRISFAVFAVVLIAAGVPLVLGRAGIFPWPLTPQQSALYGWILLGAATYFVYGLWRPLWPNAQGQLLGFLAYDLILILPLAALPFGSGPFLLPNLVIYIAVLTYSGILAVWYLFLNRGTRISLKPAK